MRGGGLSNVRIAVFSTHSACFLECLFSISKTASGFLPLYLIIIDLAQ